MDLLRGEVRHGYEISFLKGLGPFWGCNSAEISVSRRARSIGESITRWVPAGRGDHVQTNANRRLPGQTSALYYQKSVLLAELGLEPSSG